MERRGRQHTMLGQLARKRIMPEASVEVILAAYEAVLTGLWEQLVPVVGERGARALFDRAIRVASRELPVAGGIKTSDAGIDFTSLRTQQTRGDPETVGGAAESLTGSVSAVVEELLGQGLLEALVKDVQSASERRGQDRPP